MLLIDPELSSMNIRFGGTLFLTARGTSLMACAMAHAGANATRPQSADRRSAVHPPELHCIKDPMFILLYPIRPTCRDLGGRRARDHHLVVPVGATGPAHP